MGNVVWYCSECGDGPIGTWNPQCTSCGHLYCGSCHTEDPYTPNAVQDETKEQDFERPSKSSYRLFSGPRLTITDPTSAPTESLMHSYENSQPLSHDRKDGIQQVMHTISPGETLSEQDDPRLKEAKQMHRPSNPPSCLLPTDVSPITKDYASSLTGHILSSRRVILCCRVSGCGKTFYRRGDLNRHMRSKHRDLPGDHPCAEPRCGKTFNRSDSRLEHYLEHHPWLANGPWLAKGPPIPRGPRAKDPESLPESTTSIITSRNIDSLGLGASQPTDESVRSESRFEGHGNNDRSVLDDWMNSALVTTKPWRLTNRRYSESNERPPSIVSEDAITLDEIHPQNDSQIIDPVEDINDEWDNQSVRSIESSATLASRLSGYTSVEMESATIELRRLLLEDIDLAKLYQLAIEDTNIGPERLQRNLGRLLKQMAQDLKVEASKELEILTSRFVAVKARNIAHCIVQDHRVTRQARQTHEVPGESESEHEDNAIDENRFEDLTVFRTFLVESDAFQIFQSRLETFVHPKRLPEVEAKIEIESTGTNYWRSKPFLPLGWLNSICMSIISATGFVDPQIPSHAVRLKWHCVSHLTNSVQT